MFFFVQAQQTTARDGGVERMQTALRAAASSAFLLLGNVSKYAVDSYFPAAAAFRDVRFLFFDYHAAIELHARINVKPLALSTGAFTSGQLRH